MKRQYKKNRAKRRSAWETYNYWYNQKTKTDIGKRKYSERLTREEFENAYENAKLAGFKNPAKTIAEGQRKLQYSFQRTFEKETGKKLRIEDYETKEARMQLFLNYADQVGNMELAREQFEEMY